MARFTAILTLLLTLAAPAKAQDVSEIELPEAPEGFAWQILPEIKGAFLLPSGWHFRSEERSGTNAYFFSQENAAERGSFDTGLTINAIRNIGDKTGRPACNYAQAFSTLAATQSDQDLLGRSQHNTEPFCGFMTRYRGRKPTGEAYIVHQLAIGNATTDTLYLVIFESPEASWEGAWSKGALMTERFVLDRSM